MNSKAKRTANRNTGIAARVVMVIVLALTLVGVLRWSMSVTSANAKQISHNLSQIQQRMDTQAAREQDGTQTGGRERIGPSIDPVGSGKR